MQGNDLDCNLWELQYQKQGKERKLNLKKEKIKFPMIEKLVGYTILQSFGRKIIKHMNSSVKSIQPIFHVKIRELSMVKPLSTTLLFLVSTAPFYSEVCG